MLSRRPPRAGSGTGLRSLVAAAALAATAPGAVAAPPALRPPAAAAQDQVLVGTLRASPFRGALIPGAAMAGDADATALETNPGQLALLDGASWALVSSYWGERTLRAGRGTGLMLGTPLFFGLSLGAGFQWLDPTLPAMEASYEKLHLGLGLRLGRAVGVGASWDHLVTGPYGGRSSFTVGLGLRLATWLSMGAAVRDLARPSLAADLALPRTWDGELAVRPLGTDRLELMAGLRLHEASRRLFRPRGRVNARVGRGLFAFAEVDSGHDNWQVTRADGTRMPQVAWSALAGLQVDLGRLGVTAAALGARPPGSDADDSTRLGGSFMVRALPTRRAPLVARRQVARLELRNLENDARFIETVVRLRRLGDDPTVGALLLEIDGLGLGLGRIEELRTLIEEVRRRKPVFAQASSLDTREYYLATACDRISVHPAGDVNIAGFAQTVTFFKGTLDKLGVAVELVRIAEYKGAMEPFVMTEQSEPVRQNRNELVDDHFKRLLEAIARGRAARGIGAERARALIDQAVFSPGEARRQGLIDAVADDKDVEQFVRASLGRNWPVRDAPAARLDPRLWVPSRVAMVMVDGAIVEAEGGLPFNTGEIAFGDRIVEALEAIEKDSSVKALVLRVNSPGGSAFASDRIARAVARVRKAGKPVVVSMGDVAASGGYYVSAPGQEIFASQGTVTGSIGIFSYKIDVHDLMDKLGVSAETTKRGERADLFSPYRAWSDEERGVVQGRIGTMYGLFLNTIAQGRRDRGITAERADELGRGRLFTGSQALAVRLVDRIGGISAAIDEAARRAGVPLGPARLPELVLLPRRIPSPLETLMRLRGGLEATAPPSIPPLLARPAASAARLLGPLLMGKGTGVEARMPYDIEIR
jgi:protease IV